MKAWQLVILGLILVSLVLFYFFKQRPRSQEMSRLFITLLSELKDNEPDLIEAFSRKDDSVHLLLKKGSRGWMVFVNRGKGGFWVPAKGQKVKKLLSDLLDFTGELRSSSKEYLDSFGLGAGQGLEIILKKSGKEISRVVVGKKGPSWGSCFVKRDDEAKVYLVSRDLLADFDIWTAEIKGPVDIRSWIDLNVLSIAPQDIMYCSYSKGKEVWALKRDRDNEKSWTVVRNGKSKPISKDQALDILREILSIHSRDVTSATDFKDKTPRKDMESLTCKDNNGITHSVLIGRCSQSEGLCLIRTEKGYVYKVDRKVIAKLRDPFASPNASRKSGKKEGSYKRK